MRGSRALLTSLAALLWAMPTAVTGKTATNTMDARIDVDTSCRLNTTPLAFGNASILSGQVDASASFVLQCGPGVAYSVALDNGLNFAGQRRMANGNSGQLAYVRYDIFRDAARTQAWGASGAASVTGITPANGLATLTAYGRVPNTRVLPRVYLDVVTVTVTF